MTTSVAGPRISSKALPKAKTAPKKAHGYRLVSAACPNQYSFLNFGKTNTSEKYAQQMDEMHRKLQGLQPALANRKGSILHRNAQPHITILLRNDLLLCTVREDDTSK